MVFSSRVRSFVFSLMVLALLWGPRPLAAADNFLRGDTNVDEWVDLSDAVELILYLFAGRDAPRCPDSADANDDGGLNVSDPITILNYLFLGGTLPPPVGLCGRDPTRDLLRPCLAQASYCSSPTAPMISNLRLVPAGPYPELTGDEHLLVQAAFDYADPDVDIVEVRTTLDRPDETPEVRSEYFEPGLSVGGFVAPLGLDASFVAGAYELSFVLVDAIGGESEPASLSFTVSAALPHVIEITALVPETGSPGDEVTIEGRGFVGEDPEETQVTFEGDLPALVVSITDTTIEVVVPNGALTGPVRVSRRAGETSSSDFTVPTALEIIVTDRFVVTGQSRKFEAVFAGTVLGEVEWTVDGSLQPAPGYGVLETSGNRAAYTAPEVRPETPSMRLRCAAVDDPDVYDEVSISIVSPVPSPGEAVIASRTGGRIPGVDGRSGTFFRPGVLSEDARIRVRVPDLDTIPGLPTDHEVFGAVEVREVGPDGVPQTVAQLLGSATFTIPLRRYVPRTKELRVFSLSDSGEATDTGQTLQYDAGDPSGTFQATEFGLYVATAELAEGYESVMEDHVQSLADLFGEFAAEVPEGMGHDSGLLAPLRVLEGLRTPVYVRLRDGVEPDNPAGPFGKSTAAWLVFPDGTTARVSIPLVQPSAEGWEVGLEVPVPVLPDCDGPTIGPEGALQPAEQKTARIELGYGDEKVSIPVEIDCLCELEIQADARPPEPLPAGVHIFDFDWEGKRKVTLQIEDALDSPLRFSRLTIGPGTELGWVFSQGPTALLDRPAWIEVTNDVVVEGTLRWTGYTGLHGGNGDGADGGGEPRGASLFHGGRGGRGGPWTLDLESPPDQRSLFLESCTADECTIISGADGTDGLSAGYYTRGRGGAPWDRPSSLGTILAVTRLIISLPGSLVGAAAATYDLYNEIQLYEHSDENMRASAGGGGIAARPFEPPDLELAVFLPPRGGGGGGGSGKAKVSLAKDHAGGSGGGGGGGAPGLTLVVGRHLRIAPGGLIEGGGGRGGSGGHGDEYKAAPGGGGGGGHGAQIVIVANSIENSGILEAPGGLGGPSGKIVEDDLGILVPKGFGIRGDGGLLRYQAPIKGQRPSGFSGVYRGPRVFLDQVDDHRVQTRTFESPDLSVSFFLGNVEEFDPRRIFYGSEWDVTYRFYVVQQGEPWERWLELDSIDENSAVAYEPVTLERGLNSIGVQVDRDYEEGRPFVEVHPWEQLHVFWFPGAVDTDDDGMFDGLEIAFQADPSIRDTDSDGASDWREVFELHTNPSKLDLFKPDLTVSSLEYTPASPSVGDDLTLTFTVRNIGYGDTGTAPVGEVRIWIISDGTDDHDFFSIPRLGPQSSWTGSYTFEDLPATGDYEFVVEPNYEYGVLESRYDNNERSVTVTVTP